MGYVALYREWRPQQFSDIVGQEHISRTLQNAIQNDRIAHAYLFCGPRGTGKTTTAKVLAKALNCLNGPGVEPCNRCENCLRVTEGNSMDVMEIDAASNRGIDEIRDLREKVKFAPTQGKYRIYIIDEVHMLTTEAFNALLKTLEEPPAHVIFVLATTEPHKIPTTILSRCQRFDFWRIGLAEIVNRLRTVVKEVGVEAEDDALNLIARTAEGGMRDALSVLDQCISFSGSNVLMSDVEAILGTVNAGFFVQMTDCFIKNDVTRGLQFVDELVNQGKDVRQFAKDLTEHFRNLLIMAVADGAEELVPVSAEMLGVMLKQAGELGQKRIINFIELFTSTEREMKWTSQPRLILELAVIKASEKSVVPDYDELLERVTKLEQMVSQMGQAGTAEPGQGSQKSAAQVKPGPKSGGQNQPNREAESYQPGDTGQVGPLNNEQIKLDPEALRRSWPDILERIKKVQMSARAFLLEGKPVDIRDGQLILCFSADYGFHKEKVEQPDTKHAIEQVIKEVTGADLKLLCKFTSELEAGGSKTASAANDSPLAEKAAGMFGPDVIEILD